MNTLHKLESGKGFAPSSIAAFDFGLGLLITVPLIMFKNISAKLLKLKAEIFLLGSETEY